MRIYYSVHGCEWGEHKPTNITWGAQPEGRWKMLCIPNLYQFVLLFWMGVVQIGQC